jgi:hypothetical protein
MLIKSLMKRRPWWHETKNINEANFVWTQLRVSSVFERQKESRYIKDKDEREETERLENTTESQHEEGEKTPVGRNRRKSIKKNLFTVMKYMLTPAKRS